MAEEAVHGPCLAMLWAVWLEKGDSTCEALLHTGISHMSMTAGHALVTEHDSMSYMHMRRPTRLLLPQRPQAKHARSMSSLLSH